MDPAKTCCLVEKTSVMYRAIVLALLLILSNAATAKDLPFVMPEGSKLVPTEHDVLPWVDFSGQVTIRARFQFQQPQFDLGTPLELRLYPDDASLKKLPYLNLRGPEQAEEIIARNPMALASTVLSPAILQRVISGKHPYASGWGEFKISNFGGGFECDSATFVADILPGAEVESVEMVGLGIEQHGC